MKKFLWLILFTGVCLIVLIELNTKTGGEIEKIKIKSNENVVWIEVCDHRIILY